jgi:hypothetical protein
MGILVPFATLVIAWILTLLDVAAPSGTPDEPTMESAVRWLLFIPGGFMFLASGVMHTVFAKSTAKNIGWQTNGFQYEIGFVSLGLGLAGIIAANSAEPAWLPIAVAQSVFLVLAGANHVREIVKDKNVAPGNTLILLYDFGLPVSYLIALISISGS